MPWTERTAPNVMLEVTDACNITCGVCFQKRGSTLKPIDQLEHELRTACRLRRLHTATISGGEPTLHPGLCEIVRLIKRRGLHSFLLTNGVLADTELLGRLKRAGLDSVLFHVDPWQRRPDLPDPPRVEDALARLGELVRLATDAALDVSASFTLGPGSDVILPEVLRFFFSSTDLSFLFLARGIDLASPPSDASIPALQELDPQVADEELAGLRKMQELLRGLYGLEPFAFIPGNHPGRWVWVSYFVPQIFCTTGVRSFKIRSNRADAWLMELPRLVSGRYVHKTTQNAFVTALRLALNGLTTGRLCETAGFLGGLLRRGARLRHKMIVYDHGPTPIGSGQYLRCEYCPTAIVRGERLQACCEPDP